MCTEILSVGIDIGTSTTQVVFSKIKMENTATYFAIPHVSIVGKEVVYQSKIYMTPLLNKIMIDGDKIKNIVEEEFRIAGYTPEDTKTGAVIITGESAKKENSAVVLEKLSRFAGDFVVSTAGPDLEAVIAGKGSGARAYSEEEACLVANLDIGGGTTNIVLFDCGEVVGKGCFDIGGRLIKIDKESKKITYISKSVKSIAKAVGLHLEEGNIAIEKDIQRLTQKMAELLEQSLEFSPQEGLLREIQTPGSSWLLVRGKIKMVCFSGGVADTMYGQNDDFSYGDIGVFLGRTLSEKKYFANVLKMKGKETIRATVVGAGSYTTSISGSTITYTKDIFPLKNIPVLKLKREEEEGCFSGETQSLNKKVKWFLQQSQSEMIILALEGKKNPTYLEITRLAVCIGSMYNQIFHPEIPILIVVEEDMAKALGIAVYNHLEKSRSVVCLDSIRVDEQDYVDMGKPLMDGLVIPIVIKTLIFG